MVRLIGTVVVKDITLYFRNRFFALISVLGLVVYTAIYFLMPAQVTEEFSFGVFFENPEQTQVDERMALLLDGMTLFASRDELIAGVEAGDYTAGLVLMEPEIRAIERGEAVRLSLYLAPGTPPELRGAIPDILGMGVNWANPSGAALASLHFEETQEVLGPDLLDDSVPIRDRMLPMLLLAILAMETLALATLITQEARMGTAQAILTTPLTLAHFFTGKAVMGVGLAFAQVLILIGVTGKLFVAPAPVLALLLVGSVLVTGIAFLVAAIAKDSMSAMGWGMIALLALVLPGLVVIFPGINTGWADRIPSYFLVDGLHRTLNYGAGLADITRNLSLALAAGLGSLLLGTFFLRRRFQ